MARQIAIDLVGRDVLSKSLAVASESTRMLKRSLDDLSKHVSVDVDADTAKAREELARTRTEADRLDGKKAEVKVKVDTAGMMSGLQAIGIALTGLAAIPVGATLGAGVLALVPAFAAAGLGAAGLAAVAAPAINEIKAALQAQTQAQAQSGAAAVAAQSRALALAGAQQQLASAVRQAAYAHTQALQQVTQAEQQYTQTQQSALQAERDLMTARKDAAKQLQDQANSAADARLAERQATLDLADAETNYSLTLRNPAATAAQKERAKLAVDQARQSLKERHLATERAIADEKAGASAGVEGSNAVRQARLRLAQANQAVANAEKALAAARANVARTDQQSADQVASARRALTAASLQGAGATNALQAAMAKLSPSARNLMGHWTGLRDTFTKWRKSMEPTVLPIFGRALDMLKGQIPSLTPIVKGAAGAVNGLVTDIGKGAKSPFWTQFKTNLTHLVPTAITSFGKTAGNVATGLAGIINAFIPYAPSLLAWITKISGKFADWGKGLGGSNQISQFMTYVREQGPKIWEIVQNIATAAKHVATALSGMGGSSLSGFTLLSQTLAGLSPGQIQGVAAGFVAVRAAMVGVSVGKSIGAIPQALKDARDGFGKLTSGAAKAGRGISGAFTGSAGILRKSLDVAGSGWSKLITGAQSAGRAAATAAADVGRLALSYAAMGLKAAWAGIQLVALKVAQVAIKAATIAWTAVQWLLDAALAANPLGLIIIAIVAVVGAVVYAWTHFAWFRDGVMAVVHAIAAVVMWWWHNIVEVAFHAVAAIAIWLYAHVIKPYFALVTAAFHAVAAVVMWWWHNVVERAFHAVAAIISFWWHNVVQPVFRLVTGGFSFLANAISSGVSTVVNFVGGLASKILSAVSGFGSMLWNAGKNLIMGLINGVGSMANALWNAVVGLAKSALHGILSTFGIASPSKVMHEAGGHLVQGLINGVAAKMPAGGIAGIMAGQLGKLGPMSLHAGMSLTAGRSAAAMAARAANGGADHRTILEIRSGGAPLEDLLVQLLRKAIRVQGGNVQVVLGTGR